MAIKHVRIANVDYDVNDARIEAIDSALSTQSDNPVKNRAVAGEFAQVSYVGDTLEVVGTIPDTEPEVSIPSGIGEENVIEAITFNGTSVPVTNKVAAITVSIPTVPTISTDISSDSSSNVKTASPKAVKDYVDGVVGDIETLLAAI